MVAAAIVAAICVWDARVGYIVMPRRIIRRHSDHENGLEFRAKIDNQLIVTVL
jgi:hypothetical protein